MAPLSAILRQGVQEPSMTLSVSSRAHADLALAVYLEPHVEGRRVLLLGEAQGVLADRFDRLASHLEIIDPVSREPSRGEVPELPFDDSSFDLVLVCDVSALPEPARGAVAELRRVLARGGLLAVSSELLPKRSRGGAARAPEATPRRSPVQALEQLLASEFRNVRVLAQTPLAGYALGDLQRARGEESSIDSSLVETREPERVIGLASEARLPVEPRLWVELPIVADKAEPVAAPDPGLIEELRRVEDEAREALHRESDLLRKLEVERRARVEAEQLAERARSFERKLLAAEADYDDAVARVRYFESAIAEHEASVRHDRERREASERELVHVKSQLASAAERVAQSEAERAASRADYEVSARELEQLELRLVELGKQVLALESDKKQHEQTARDLLEELRRVEQDKTAAVEHDARVAELEAERERAVQRALEAEVAREAAQMRADELRSELEEREAQRASARDQQPSEHAPGAQAAALELELTRARADAARQRGECVGLRLRLNEAEIALGAALAPVQPPAAVHQVGPHHGDELSELRLRLAHAEAALHAMREAPSHNIRPRELEAVAATDDHRVHDLEAQLQGAEQRLAELTRELEEADRFAEIHAEDAERLGSVEAELAESRTRLDELEDELRALEDELRSARIVINAQQDDLARTRQTADDVAAEAASRLEQIAQRETERDDARAALAEARSILSQLAGRVGGDENDPPSIVQAVLAQRASHGESERAVDELRDELSRSQARIQELEHWLNEARNGSSNASAPIETTEH
jgi:SAM-dependent methyltransferase